MSAPVIPECEAFRFDAGDGLGALLQHGLTGCPASMRPMGEWLAERGISVVGPRLPGHGTRWEDLGEARWQDWEAESERALLELAGRCGTVLTVGLSVGGSMALHLAARNPEVVRGVVAINPLVTRFDLRLAPLGALVVRSSKGVGNDMRKPGGNEYSYERVSMRGAAELGRFIRTVDRELPRVRQPLLLLSSDVDHVVKPANSRRVARRVGSSRKELYRMKNSFHVATLDYDAPAIFQRVLAFARSLDPAFAAGAP